RFQFAWLRSARVRFHWMPRVKTADPCVPLGEQYVLQVGPVFQAVGKATRSAKSGGVYAQPLLHCHGAHPNVLVNELRGRFAVSQPGGALDAVWGLAYLSGLDVDMIVSVIANAVAELHNLLQPRHAGLLENTANNKEVHFPAGRCYPARGAQRV